MYTNRVILNISMLFIAVLICFSSIFVEISYGQESKEDQFNEIKEIVVDSTKSISYYGAKDAYNVINDALEKFRTLYQKVKDAEHVDHIIDEVTDGLNEIAVSYEKVAHLKVDIMKNRGKHTRNLRDAIGQTNKTIEVLNIEKRKILSETAALNKKLSNMKDGMERKKIEITIKGNESVVRSIEAQVKIWGLFHTAQEKLIVRLGLNEKKIDLLLHVLKTNSYVYREAATVAKLRRNAKDALKNLQSLSEIQSILGDLQESWIEVDDLVSEISNADFHIDLNE